MVQIKSSPNHTNCSMYFLILLLLLVTVSGFSQKYIQINTTVTGTQNYVARDSVCFHAGFSYSASSGQTLTASVVDTLICNTSYQLTQTNPDTRQLDQTKVVGTTMGSVNVSSTGDAGYNIPIFTPPGTAGMQPNLSLYYNSQAGNGNFGWGWNISGFSSIRRVPSTIYHDGFVDPINFDASDRFELDGQRLICTSGTYGADGAVYATESDVFSKIISHGNTGGGPQWFEILTKDGTDIQYGNSTDSRMEDNSNTNVFNWYINKATDVSGNYILYQYHKDKTKYEFWPYQIQYTGNGLQLPYNTIYFYYQTRNDILTSYSFGSKFLVDVICDRIKIVSEGNIVKDYRFNYFFDKYSKLSEILEYGSDGKGFNSTLINWSPTNDGSTGLTSTPITTQPSGYLYKYGDFNHDGRMDYVQFSTTNHTWALFLANSTGLGFSQSASGVLENSATHFTDFYVGDVNGDGKCDLLESNTSSITGNTIFRVYYSTGTNFAITDSFTVKSLNVSVNIGDFIGNGKADCFVRVNSVPTQWYLYSDTTHPGQTGHMYIVNENSGPGTNFYSDTLDQNIDFNSDGKMDIFKVNNTTSEAWTVNSNTNTITTLFSDPHLRTDSCFNIQYGDFYGNGKTDIFYMTNTYTFFICYSTGTGLVHKKLLNYNPSMVEFDAILTGDVDGDGRTEIIAFGKDDGSNKGISIFRIQNDTLFETFMKVSSINNINPETIYVADFDGDGTDEILYNNNGVNSYIYKIGIGKKGYLVNSITNGLNTKTTFQYKCITDNTVYTPSSNAAYPLQDYVGTAFVVSKLLSDNTMGGAFRQSYSYQSGKIHLAGKGFLGFMNTSVTNNQTGITSKQFYTPNTTYYVPVPLKMQTLDAKNNLLKSTTFTNQFKDFTNRRYFSYISHLVDSNNVQSIVTSRGSGYDNYGNLLNDTINNGTDAQSISANVYGAFGSWCTNRLTKSTVTTTRTSQSPYTRVTEYAYDIYGRCDSQIIERSNPNKLTTFIAYNSFGNTTRTTTSSTTQSRYVNWDYDTKGRFPIKTTNALTQFSQKQYDGRFGTVTQTTDVNGNITNLTYDGFGRLKSSASSDSGNYTVSYVWPSGSYPTYASYGASGQRAGNPPTTVWYDKIGRQLRTEKTSFDGTKVWVDAQYDTLGKVTQVSDPYFNPGGTAVWNKSYVDQLGRDSLIVKPSVIFSYSYSGKTVTITNVNTSQSWTKTIDATKSVVTASDAGGSLSYSYYSSGLVHQITSPSSVNTTMEYDLFGHQTKLTDPSKGIYTYVYDAFGELTKQKHNTDSVQLSYDLLGRVTSTIEREGTTTYTYDTQPHGIGALALVSGLGNSKLFYYDRFSRPNQVKETIDATAYTEKFGYDAYNRIDSLIYPSGFGIGYTYQNGYISQISRLDNSASIWQAPTYNARDELTQYKHGNNLVTTRTYDTYGLPLTIATGTVQNLAYQVNAATGNFTFRKDIKHNLQENFAYDALDRLDSITRQGQSPFVITYASNGNINSKSDIGTYSYTGSGPFNVASVSNTSGVIDTTRQDITYSSFDKANTIKQGIYQMAYTYGYGKERCKAVYTQSGSVTKTKYYVQGNYEKELNGSGVAIRDLNYISTPAGITAVYDKVNSVMYYLLADCQGSLNVVTDLNGAIVQELSYDAYGRRRNPTDWTYNNLPSSYTFERGYSMHEHMDWFGGLINMNGRVYDSKLGRFLNSDKFVQDAGNTQNYNSYSYCLNNPLKYSDPTGMKMKALPEPTPVPWSSFMDLLYGNSINGVDDNGSGGGIGDYANGSPGGNNSAAAGSYTYDYGSGCYRNSQGQIVPFDEVYNNYVVPNSFFSGNGALGFNAAKNIMDVDNHSNSATLTLPSIETSALATPLELPSDGFRGNVQNAQYASALGLTASLDGIGWPTSGTNGFVIISDRFAESPNSTISSFIAYGPIPTQPVTGYFLEPGGHSTDLSDQDRRILAATYDMNWTYSPHFGTNMYLITNADLSADRGVRMHPGYYAGDTQACLLPGNSYGFADGNYYVGGSNATYNQLLQLLGGNKATLIINEIH
jgi:RHS repeat-associated protein